ncbi:MAG: hypothetical protein WC508_02315 [Patescibacteria group bacterium]
MKNLGKLAKIISFTLCLVTVISVTFFVNGLVVLVQAADSNWQEPNQPPPLGNKPGFIYNSKDSVQTADINISGQATVNKLISTWLCFPPGNTTDCKKSWNDIGGAFWGSSGANIYNTNGGNVGINSNLPQAKFQVTSADPTIAIFAGSTTGNQAVQIGNSTGFMNIGVGVTTKNPYLWSNNGNLFIGDDANPTLFIQGMNNGKVAIGTTQLTGLYKFIVMSGTTQGAYVQNSQGTQGYLAEGKRGIRGQSLGADGIGVEGFTDNGKAVIGTVSGTGWSGYFDGGQGVYVNKRITFPRYAATGYDGQNLIETLNDPSGYNVNNLDLAIAAQRNLYLLMNEQPYNLMAGVGDLVISRDSAGWAESNPYLVVKNGGNVGIGVRNPSVNLEVKGKVQIDGSGGVTSLTSTGGHSWFGGTMDVGNVPIWLRGSDQNGGTIALIIRNNNSDKVAGTTANASKNGDLMFSPKNNSNDMWGFRTVEDGNNKVTFQLGSNFSGLSFLPVLTVGNDIINSIAYGSLGLNTTSFDYRNAMNVVGRNSAIEASVSAGSYSSTFVLDPNNWNRAGHFKITNTSYPAEVYLATSPYSSSYNYGVWASGTAAGLYGQGPIYGVVGQSYYGGVGVKGLSNCDTAGSEDSCNNATAISAEGTGYADALNATVKAYYNYDGEGGPVNYAFQPNSYTAETAAVRVTNEWSNGWGVYSNGNKNLFGGITLNKANATISANTNCADYGAGTMLYSLNTAGTIGHFYGCVQTAANTFRWKQLDN